MDRDGIFPADGESESECAAAHPVTILVCSTCRDESGSDAHPHAGSILARDTSRAATGENIHVRTVECLGNCKRRLSAAFEERRKRLVHAIDAFLPEWRSTDSAGGTSLWLEGPRGTDSRDLAAAAASRSVIIEPGDRFFDRSDKPTRFMRLGFSSIALQHIEPGIRELATAAGRRPAAA